MTTGGVALISIITFEKKVGKTEEIVNYTEFKNEDSDKMIEYEDSEQVPAPNQSIRFIKILFGTFLVLDILFTIGITASIGTQDTLSQDSTSPGNAGIFG